MPEVKMVRYAVVERENGQLDVIESKDVEKGDIVVTDFVADANADYKEGAWWSSYTKDKGE